MERAVNELNRAGNRMAGDLNTMIADGEDLLKAAASVSGEGYKAAKAKLGERMRIAGTALADASRPLVQKTRASAAVADEYVHGNPWTVAGVAFAAGVLLAFIVSKR